MKKIIFCALFLMLIFNSSNAQTDYCATGKFYDSGGPDFYYSTTGYYETIYPTSTDYYVSVTFNYFDVLNTDFLEIYDGPNKYGPIIGRYSGTQLKGLTIKATNITGALTFRFYAAGGANKPGWDADVVCLEKPSDCLTGKFNDTGGADGYYGDVNYTVTFRPDSLDEFIKVTFNSFSINLWTDYIQVYDGTDTNSPLIGEYTANDLNGETLTSTDPSGALTFKVVSNAGSVAVYYPGWDADVNCLPKPDCAPPLNVSASNITMNNALISWVPYGTESSWNVEYGPSGFTPGTGISTVVSDKKLTLLDLLPETTYDVYVTVDCAAGGQGELSKVCTFKTNNSSCLTTKFYDKGGVSGSYSNYEDYNQTIYPTNANSSLQVYFNAFSLEKFDYLTIYNGPSTSSPLIGTYNLTSLEGKTIVSTHYTGALTFNFKSSAFNTDKGWDADLGCTSKPNCFPPKDIKTLNVGAYEATLSWTAIESETSWNVEFGLSGFTQGTGTVIEVNNTQILLPNLASNTNYDVYITTNCDEGGKSPSATFYNFKTNISRCTIGDFFDTGGKFGSYSPKESYVKTFSTGDYNGAVEVFFSLFSLHSSDYLYVYNGPTIDSPLIGKYSLKQLEGVTIKSSDVSGSLTFKFESDTFYTIDSGWRATASIVNCVSLSANRYKKNSEINIYPNPNNGEFNVNLGGDLINAIKVYSTTGQLVFEKNNISDSEYLVKLPSHLSSNIYFLKIESDKGVAFEKIVKN